MAQIAQDTIELLKRCGVDGNTITMPRFARDDYLKVNKVLENLGGRWNRKEQAHVFDGKSSHEIRELMETTIAGGCFTDRRKELQYFPTPERLARLMVEVACIQYGDCVLEPSAGQGAIVREIIQKTPRVVSVEIDAENCRQLSWRLAALGVFVPIEADFLNGPRKWTASSSRLSS